MLNAEMLSYSRSRGLFAGISLKARRFVRMGKPTGNSTAATQPIVKF